MSRRLLGSGDMIDQIAEIFARHGAQAYLGESVTMAEHMLQTAALAEAEGASDALIAAALLHDIGYFASVFVVPSPQDAVDDRHDVAGAQALQGHFPSSTIACIRLHVAAKRYLCATDPTYHAKLSEASRHTLVLQGGPMTTVEIAEFRRLEFYGDAVRVRLWDDGGKVVGASIPTFESFRPLLRRVAVQT